ncbi:TetR family transcriptional regulator [Herbiconiux moechotypicola]|uniref:HTH tetR-type domain-containing protein n=1 Tax=Herbiconiux moechotypicola TaxID=637393 RepID=A0ABP5R4Y4_9MICO|nr:TetR family transcriptional regulator [Herbiconiux moechotypicola]MCS5731990.1 TetR family transcriptional regulator [Herbiconiux moechotypicola]
MSETNWAKSPTPRVRVPKDEERSALLNAALEHVAADGLTAGFSHLELDELVREAGVSRNAVNRIWESKDDFYNELLGEVANQVSPGRADEESLIATWEYLGFRADELRTPEGRRRILVDVIGLAAEQNFESVTSSVQWRTYVALSSTANSYPDARLRERIIGALRASELAFLDQMEVFYRNIVPAVGYRLRPDLNDDYRPLVVAAAAIIEGLGIARTTIPDLVEARYDVDNEGRPAEVSLAGLSYHAIITAFIVPDPAYDAEAAIARLSGGIDEMPVVQPRSRDLDGLADD